MNKKVLQKGFTLIELMIVVAIIGIISFVVAPKFADVLRKAKEAKTKANLAALKSSLTIYCANNEGKYPLADFTKKGGPNATIQNSSVLATSLTPHYITKIPECECPTYHSASNSVTAAQKIAPNFAKKGDGMWFYIASETSPNWGTVKIMCSHTDSKGVGWDEY